MSEEAHSSEKEPSEETAPEETSPAEVTLPAELPVLPVRNTVLFPAIITPMIAAVERARRLVDDVLAVEPVLASRVQDAADTVRGIHPEHVRGVAERGDGESLLVLLELQSMLADERLIVHEEVV